MSRDEKPELRVPGWFVALFIGVSGSLSTAVEILPAGPWWQAAKILLGGVTAVGVGVAMLSAGRKK